MCCGKCMCVHWAKWPAERSPVSLTVTVIELALMPWPGVRKWYSRRWSDRRCLSLNWISIEGVKMKRETETVQASALRAPLLPFATKLNVSIFLFWCLFLLLHGSKPCCNTLTCPGTVQYNRFKSHCHSTIYIDFPAGDERHWFLLECLRSPA